MILACKKQPTGVGFSATSSSQCSRIQVTEWLFRSEIGITETETETRYTTIMRVRLLAKPKIRSDARLDNTSYFLFVEKIIKLKYNSRRAFRRSKQHHKDALQMISVSVNVSCLYILCTIWKIIQPYVNVCVANPKDTSLKTLIFITRNRQPSVQKHLTSSLNYECYRADKKVKKKVESLSSHLA